MMNKKGFEVSCERLDEGGLLGLRESETDLVARLWNLLDLASGERG